MPAAESSNSRATVTKPEIELFTHIMAASFVNVAVDRRMETIHVSSRSPCPKVRKRVKKQRIKTRFEDLSVLYET